MPDYDNRITNSDPGTKYVQRRVIGRRNKNLICEVRLKPSSFGLRRTRSEKWYSVRLDDLIGWMIDPKNPKIARHTS